MSHFWHAHWAEYSYKPRLLGNWEVPNWHPEWPCKKHCITTNFLCDKSGHLLPGKPRSKRSPWGDYKGTWELPLKIDRKMANKLSETPKYKMAVWKAHKKLYESSCLGTPANTKNAKSNHNRPKKPMKKRR